MSRGNVVSMIWNNFKKSFTSRQRTGDFMGEDYLGNKYFEIPAQPQIGKRRPERWFTPPGNNMDANFDKEISSEWESWLRHRRYLSQINPGFLPHFDQIRHFFHCILNFQSRTTNSCRAET